MADNQPSAGELRAAVAMKRVSVFRSTVDELAAIIRKEVGAAELAEALNAFMLATRMELALGNLPVAYKILHDAGDAALARYRAAVPEGR